jgi:hypothetical protein
MTRSIHCGGMSVNDVSYPSSTLALMEIQPASTRPEAMGHSGTKNNCDW